MITARLSRQGKFNELLVDGFLIANVWGKPTIQDAGKKPEKGHRYCIAFGAAESFFHADAIEWVEDKADAGKAA